MIPVRIMFLFVIICLPLTLLSSCAPKPAWDSNEKVTQIKITESELPPYQIQPFDSLEVKFFNRPELNEKISVYPDGTISLQLIGSVKVHSLTIEEITESLSTLYEPKIRNPEITVFLRNIYNQRVFVGGEVLRPQAIKLIGKMDALQAIYEVGGFRDTACAESVVLIRRQSSNTISGSIIDLDAFLNGREGGANIVLQPNDIIFIPRTNIAQANIFVDKYIRKLIPFSMGAVVQYNYTDGF